MSGRFGEKGATNEHTNILHLYTHPISLLHPSSERAIKRDSSFCAHLKNAVLKPCYYHWQWRTTGARLSERGKAFCQYACAHHHHRCRYAQFSHHKSIYIREQCTKVFPVYINLMEIVVDARKKLWFLSTKFLSSYLSSLVISLLWSSSLSGRFYSIPLWFYISLICTYTITHIMSYNNNIKRM